MGIFVWTIFLIGFLSVTRFHPYICRKGATKDISKSNVVVFATCWNTALVVSMIFWIFYHSTDWFKAPITPPSGSMHQVLDNPSMMRWCDQILMTDVLICIDGICCTTKVVIRKTREALFRNDGSMGLAYMKTINITIPVGKYASFMDPMGFNFPSSRHPFFKPLLQAVWKSQAKLPGVWGFMADWEFWWHFRLGFKSMAKHRCNYVEALLET